MTKKKSWWKYILTSVLTLFGIIFITAIIGNLFVNIISPKSYLSETWTPTRCENVTDFSERYVKIEEIFKLCNYRVEPIEENFVKEVKYNCINKTLNTYVPIYSKYPDYNIPESEIFYYETNQVCYEGLDCRKQLIQGCGYTEVTCPTEKPCLKSCDENSSTIGYKNVCEQERKIE